MKRKVEPDTLRLMFDHRDSITEFIQHLSLKLKLDIDTSNVLEQSSYSNREVILSLPPVQVDIYNGFVRMRVTDIMTQALVPRTNDTGSE